MYPISYYVITPTGNFIMNDDRQGSINLANEWQTTVFTIVGDVPIVVHNGQPSIPKTPTKEPIEYK